MLIMKQFKSIGFIVAILVAMAFGGASCCPKEDKGAMLCGHWGCETYISCRTLANGAEQWDTLSYEVGEGHGYELWFRQDGSGKLRLNDSPAFIKEFSCTYELDEEQDQIVIHGSAWLFALYGGLIHLEENEVRFNIVTLNDSILDVWWTNEVSEAQSFYENFYLRKIVN